MEKSITLDEVKEHYVNCCPMGALWKVFQARGLEKYFIGFPSRSHVREMFERHGIPYSGHPGKVISNFDKSRRYIRDGGDFAYHEQVAWEYTQKVIDHVNAHLTSNQD